MITTDQLATYRRHRADGIPAAMAFRMATHVPTRVPHADAIAAELGYSPTGNGSVRLSDRVHVTWATDYDEWHDYADCLGEFVSAPCCPWCVPNRDGHGRRNAFHSERAADHYEYVRARGMGKHDAWLATRAMAREDMEHAREYVAIVCTVTLWVDGVDIARESLGGYDATELPTWPWSRVASDLAMELASLVEQVLDVSRVSPAWLRDAASQAIASIGDAA